MDTKLVVILGAIGVGCAWVNGYLTGSIARGRQERKTLQQVIDGKWTSGHDLGIYHQRVSKQQKRSSITRTVAFSRVNNIP